MRIRRIDRKLEKDILIGMITNKQYLARIRNSVNLTFFKNSYAKTIARWIIDFYDRYQDAPFNEIERIYKYNEREGNIEEDDVDLIGKLLQEAAEQYAECPNLNYDFLLDKTEEYFNKVQLETVFAEASEYMDDGNIDKAIKTVFSTQPVKLSVTSATDGLTDQGEIMEAFSQASESLFKLPGDIGNLINSELCRDKFIALQAPEKTGKTWFLGWMAQRALRARLKVVMFEFEMTKPQLNRRFSISIAGKSDVKKFCDGQHIPYRFSSDEPDIEGLPAGIGIEYKDFELGEPLTWQEALAENEKFYERFRLKKDKHWRLITAPARSMNMKQIDAELERLEKEEDFIADVVLIDYMDILAAENPKEQDRERINSNWIAAKAVTNKRHCLTISVTQANAQTYGLEIQTRSSFSEDHRKYAHTNGTLGLTQTATDKKNSIAKLNWLVLREGDWGENDVCYIIQCLKRGKFCVDSMIPSLYEKRSGVKLGKIKKTDSDSTGQKKFTYTNNEQNEQKKQETIEKRRRSTRCR